METVRENLGTLETITTIIIARIEHGSIRTIMIAAVASIVPKFPLLIP